MFLSETYSITDCLFYDDGVTSPKTSVWDNASSIISVSVDDTGTLLSCNTGTRHYIAKNGDVINTPFVVEFDLLGYTDSTSPSFRFSDGTNNHYFVYKSRGCSQSCHLKFIVNGEKITYQIDDGTVIDWITTSSTSFTTAFRLVSSGTEITTKYKNFQVYPI